MDHLSAGNPARTAQLDDEGQALLKDMMLLTAKPILYVCNVDELSVVSGNEITKKLEAAIIGEPAEVLYVCAGIEADIAELDTLEERREFAQGGFG